MFKKVGSKKADQLGGVESSARSNEGEVKPSIEGAPDGPAGHVLHAGLESTAPTTRIDPGKYRLDPLPLGYANTDTPGKLGMALCPGRGGGWTASSDKRPRHLGKDLDYLAITKKTDVLVCLVETWELEKLGVPNLFEECEKRGIAVEHFPIPDLEAPDDMSKTRTFVKKLVGYLEDGKNIVIHCKGGLGRTGEIAACALVELGWSAPDAIVEVRRARSPKAIQTSSQEQFIKNYAKGI